MQHLARIIVYINMHVSLNKSVLNWTPVCQLHWKTQLREKIYAPRCILYIRKTSIEGFFHTWGLYYKTFWAVIVATSIPFLPSLIFGDR
jgi:hypothetical protein